ncbi:TrkA-C domain-containing protein [Paenibacillus sp. UNCCL117]|uniref:SLC13 family permease n=1 Tax=unclassified Paenibacillus TaxID=185978 RepID=UPI00088F8260|nr:MULTISPECIES: SLC13 family permease [unclassified Paenibacillus]SDE46622.1 TrkA-C domain-containing protein [Paenibacillus sp. cl123]SFW65822.1 TrkA-C domain-containing protein [Paenibacillus sp. UNCCL117]
MTTPMLITLCLLAGAAILFMSGKVRSDLVAICSLILLVLFGILSPAEALSGFANPVVIMMMGLFVVGGGIFHTGLARMASSRMLRLAGANETRLLITVMLATSAIGAFVSNTGTVAVMLPIVVSLAASAQISPGRLLMPLAFASSLGGTLTLIGTPPNLVISETLTEAGFPGLSFFSFTPIGLVCLIVGTLLTVLLSRLLLPKASDEAGRKRRSRSLDDLAKQYQLAQNLFRVQVRRHSPVMSKPLRELDIPEQYKVNIIEIRRRSSAKNPFFKTLQQEIAGPATVIHEEDILYVYGGFEQVKTFAAANGLELLDHQTAEKSAELQTERFASHQTGIAEVLLTPNSRLINLLVKHTGFRERYQINILGIQRKGEYLLHQLKEERIRFGDALLIQGTWSNIARLAQETYDVVVVGQPLDTAASVPMNHKAPIAAGIMLLMVALMILEVFPAVVSVMIAAVLMVVTGCLRSMEEAYKTINWESIVLIGGMIPMSAAIEKTGAAALLSEQLVSVLGGFDPIVLLAGIYFTTSLLTLFISNTACAVLFAPIALSAAVHIGVSPLPYLFAVSIAASMCFAVPFSTPPNALVMSAGRYTFMDYVKVGLPLQLLLGAAMVALLPVFFPL